MCLGNPKKFEHDEDIKCYKVLVRKKNGELHAIKTALCPNLKDYIYADGENTPDNGHGLYAFGDKETAIEFANCISMFPQFGTHERLSEAKEMVVLDAIIPKNSDTYKGYQWREEVVGYMSDKLIVSMASIKTVKVKPNREKWWDLVKKLGIMGDIK